MGKLFSVSHLGRDQMRKRIERKQHAEVFALDGENKKKNGKARARGLNKNMNRNSIRYLNRKKNKKPKEEGEKTTRRKSS